MKPLRLKPHKQKALRLRPPPSVVPPSGGPLKPLGLKALELSAVSLKTLGLKARKDIAWGKAKRRPWIAPPSKPQALKAR